MNRLNVHFLRSGRRERRTSVSWPHKLKIPVQLEIGLLDVVARLTDTRYYIAIRQALNHRTYQSNWDIHCCSGGCCNRTQLNQADRIDIYLVFKGTSPPKTSFVQHVDEIDIKKSYLKNCHCAKNTKITCQQKSFCCSSILRPMNVYVVFVN